MIYEVREYVPVAGRLKDVGDLFTSVVVPLFATYEMDVVQAGFTTIGDHCFNEFVYTMRFSDLADMERKWRAFLDDPTWISALAERERTGPLYQTIRRRVVDAAMFDEVLGAPR